MYHYLFLLSYIEQRHKGWLHAATLFYLFYIIQAYIEYLKIYDSSSAGLVFLIASARQTASSGVTSRFSWADSDGLTFWHVSLASMDGFWSFFQFYKSHKHILYVSFCQHLCTVTVERTTAILM
jgi:hypothetical protein